MVAGPEAPSLDVDVEVRVAVPFGQVVEHDPDGLVRRAARNSEGDADVKTVDDDVAESAVIPTARWGPVVHGVGSQIGDQPGNGQLGVGEP